jgi:hypothetical protein
VSEEPIIDPKEANGWIGVDFDATLAEYHGWDISKGALGPAIPRMMARVRAWLKAGREVRIMTARTGEEQELLIQTWLHDNGLPKLPITNQKDRMMYQLWDDRAIQVRSNTGETVDEEVIRLKRELKRVYDSLRAFKQTLEEIE